MKLSLSIIWGRSEQSCERAGGDGGGDLSEVWSVLRLVTPTPTHELKTSAEQLVDPGERERERKKVRKKTEY